MKPAKATVAFARHKSAAEKLGLKAASVLCALNAPAQLATLLGAMPAGARSGKAEDSGCTHLLLFARGSSELVRGLPQARAALAQDGALWVAFYKGVSGKNSDISRDIIREHAMTLGLAAASIVSLDADWSALRLRPV